MPRKPHPSDWERYFGKNPQQRRGPLGLLGLTVTAGVLVAGIIFAAQFALQVNATQTAKLRATATVAWATAYAQGTATALAQQATRTPTITPTPVPLPRGQVINGGNLRQQAEIVPTNILGQVVAGDTVEILERNPADQPVWYKVRIVQTTGQLPVGQEGWLSATLVNVAPAPSGGVAAPVPGSGPLGVAGAAGKG